VKWFALLPCWLIFNIFALCVNWLLPMFSVMRDGPINNNNGFAVEPRLPTWLSWFDTFDNSLLGDGGFRATHDGGYWSQVAWLYRNNCYGFERSVLAAKIAPMAQVTHLTGDPFITDKPNGRAGDCYVEIGSYWSYDLVLRLTKTKCVKLSFGWKLKTYAEDPSRIAEEPIAQYCVTIKPLTDFVE